MDKQSLPRVPLTDGGRRRTGIGYDKRESATPCRHCHYFGGMIYEIHGSCLNPKCSAVQATPASGCSAFEREPGADDH